MPKGPTVPKPFNLSQGNKRKLEETTKEYVSFAEQVEAFQKRTPPRYHLRSRKSDEGECPGCVHRHGGRARDALTALSIQPVSFAGLAINCWSL